MAVNSDCEAIGSGLLTQPVNAVTSLAFLVAGLVVARRRPDRREFATLTGLVGVGSFLAHGPRWAGSQFAHDLTLAWVLAAVAADPLPAAHRRVLLGSVAALLAVVPKAATPIAVALAAVAIGRELGGWWGRSRTAFAALGLAAVGSMVGTLSRTGWPWCRPDSLFQGHGVWHLLAAAALAAWAGGSPRRTSVELRS